MIFENKEQKGIAVFIILIMGFVIFKATKALKTSPVTKNTEIITSKETIKLFELVDTIVNSKKTYSSKKYAKRTQPKKRFKTFRSAPILFEFNPNNISKDSIIMLGVSSKIAYNWTKYLEKGGKFKIKEDVKKIYGISDKIFKRIKNSILLPDTLAKQKYFVKSAQDYKTKKSFKNSKKNIVLEINSCNEEELIQLRGIGEVLSKRIIKFRKKLGGFTSVNQLKEVYGLPLETYDEIKGDLTVNKNNIKKLKINIWDKDTLSSFPYFNYRLASQIINYRKQHGNFTNINDLKQMKSISKNKIKQIEPYLDFAIN